MGTIKIEGLYDAAYRAYSNISFSPEKRAESTLTDYEGQLNNDLENIPESEQERYIENYKKHLFAWLSAKSRTLSAMITGPANFPVERNRRANDSEMKRYDEFVEWRKKALKAIIRRAEEAKPVEQRRNERWEQIKRGLVNTMTTIVEIDTGKNTYSYRPLFVSSLTGAVKTLAKNGETELVENCLSLIEEWNTKAEKPIITAKNSVWGLSEVSKANYIKQEEKQNAESTETEINGVRVVRNQQADRLQLFFDGKPKPEMIASLKKSAFKWSPYNGCWQRQLTGNAIYAAKMILK